MGFPDKYPGLQHRTGWNTTACEEFQILRIQRPGDTPARNAIYSIISRAGHILQLSYQGDNASIRTCKRAHIEHTLEDTPLAGNRIGDILNIADTDKLNSNKLAEIGRASCRERV